MSRHRPGTKAAAAAMARWLRNRQPGGRAGGRAATPPALTLQIACTVRLPARTIGWLRRHLVGAHRILRPPLGELSVALVGDARMSRLHEQFLGKSGPTDVMTFPLDTDARGRATSGEVVVCVPEARRRAGETAPKLEKELLLYALHGLLHLCGFDDRTDPGYRAMHRTEDMILTRLGVGPVFAPPPPADVSRAARKGACKGGRKPAGGIRQ